MIFADYEKYPIMKVGEKLELKIKNTFENVPIEKYKITFEKDADILKYDSGYLYAIKNGCALIKVSFEENFTYFGVVVGDFDESEKYIIQSFNPYPKSKIIDVFSEKKIYQHNLIENVSNYLFEDLKIIENIAPPENANRPKTRGIKHYICIHDTADIDYNAYDWSKTVYDNFYQKRNREYKVSFHYVVGNDGIYHNIPDDEYGFHAGDGTKYQYTLIPSGVYGKNLSPEISISEDGFYTIDNIKSNVVAPKYEEKILNQSDINSFGIRCKLIDNQYFLGLTWYNEVYNKIANRGGNCNSIGIESCLDEGSDIFYTWQLLAKLVAKLLYDNNLNFEDIVPHHFFSGKNCPMTILENDCWKKFMDLVKCEFEMLNIKKCGYKFALYDINHNIFNGRTNQKSLVKSILNITKENKNKNYVMYSFYDKGEIL